MTKRHWYCSLYEISLLKFVLLYNVIFFLNIIKLLVKDHDYLQKPYTEHWVDEALKVSIYICIYMYSHLYPLPQKNEKNPDNLHVSVFHNTMRKKNIEFNLY